jgi:hypothetical protein
MSTSFDPRIVLRPRTLDETFDLALAYLRSWAKDFAKLGVVVSGLTLGIIVAATYGLGLDWRERSMVVLVAVAVSERVVTVYAGRHLFGNPAKVRSSLVALLKRIVLVGFWSVIVTLPILIALIETEEEWALGVGVFLMTFWPFMLAPHNYLGEAVFLEQLPAGRALGRARALGSYRYGRALGFLIVQGLIRTLFVVSAAFGADFVVETLLQFQGVPDAVTYWAAIAGYVASGPYMALVRLFDYVDARTRREGWDIQVRFNAIAHRAREEQAKSLAA